MMGVKLSIWAYTAAVSITALALSFVWGTYGDFLEGLHYDKPMASLTAALMANPWWPLPVLLPWIIFSIFLCWGDHATVGRCLAFAAFSTLAIVLLCALTAIALIMSFIILHPVAIEPK
jgi:hypothetical protein